AAGAVLIPARHTALQSDEGSARHSALRCRPRQRGQVVDLNKPPCSSFHRLARRAVLFNSVQRPAGHDRMLQNMELHTIKSTLAASWVALTLILALVTQATG